MRTYFLKINAVITGSILLLLPWMAVSAEPNDKAALSALLALLPTPSTPKITPVNWPTALAQLDAPKQIQTNTDIKPILIAASVSPALSKTIHNILLTTIPFTIPTPLAISACQSHLKALEFIPNSSLMNNITVAALTDAFNAPLISNHPISIESAFTNKLHHALLASLTNTKTDTKDLTPLTNILIHPHKSFLAMMTDRVVSLDPIVSDIVNPVVNDTEVSLTDAADKTDTKVSTAGLFIDSVYNDIHASNAIVDITLQPVKAIINVTNDLATASLTKIASTAPTLNTTKKHILAQSNPSISEENLESLPANLSDTLKIPPRDSLTNSPTIPSMSVPEYVIVRPSDRVTFSSETSASVLKINVKEGNTFEANSILMVLDCRVQQAELQKALAQQQGTHMAVASARKLKSYGSISEFEFTQAYTQDEIAAAEVNKLHAIVEKCTIRAPFTGAVSDVLVHEHESVKPGDPLLKIVSTENLDFELQVPSTWLQWLHIGTQFDVHINELDENVSVRITKINPQIDSVSQTVRIIGTVTEPNTKLLPGMSGQANFPDNPANIKKDASTT